MDIPDLVQQALGGEEITTGISLGDEDVVCFTPTRALLYNGEGLISDEGVEEFSLDTEQLSIKRGRRKTKFVLQYIEGPESFSVPSNRGEDVLERLLEGILRVNDVLDPRESVAGVYLFSELTLAITDRRIVKHIGGAVWDEDFEVYDFADVTGLEFEQTSVATSIVVGIDGRPQRVKVPNDNAPIVRRTLQEVLFEFHDVASLDELNRRLGEDDGVDVDDSHAADDLTMGSGIDPLVTDREEDLAKGVEDPFAAESVDDDVDAEPADGSTVDAIGTGDAVGEATPESADVADASTETGDANAAETSSEGSTPADPDAETGGSSTGEGAPADTGERADADTDESAGANGSADADTDESAGANGSADADTGESAGVDSGGGTDDAGPATTDDSWGSPAGESKEESDADDPSEATGDDDVAATDSATEEQAAATAGGAEDVGVPDDVATRGDVEAVAERMAELTDAVDRQNELLKRQHRAMKQLIERLDEE